MSVGNDIVEPEATNLELSLGFSNGRCISSRSSCQGAGVNASRVDMTYDPLSELVWSPHNGLSLKCADCSFITKPSPLIWDVEPSKFSNKEKLVSSQASLVVTPRTIGGIVPLVKPNFGHFLGKSGKMDEGNSVENALAADANQKESNSKKDEDPKEHKTVDFLSLGTNETLLHEDKGSLMPFPIPSPSSPKGRNKDLTLDIENENETNVDCSLIVLPLEGLEGTAENDLPFDENARSTREERLRRGKSVMIEASPAFSKTILDREKGKEKVFSKGESSKTTSKEKNGSDESVESCNSVGVFFVGNKRGRFEQQLILGSKRVKNQIQENPVSTSFVGQRSSFMNWISNMVKGLNRVDQEKEPSLALTFANPKEDHEGGDKKIVPYNENCLQHGDGDMGFRSIFRSIYCPKSEEKEINATNESTPIGDSKELILADRVAGPSATLVSCHGDSAYTDRAEGQNSSSFETRAEEKTAIDIEEKPAINPGSLWITRFSQKPHENLVNLEGPSCASKKADHKSNEISSFESNYVIPSPNVKNKGVIASVFAKRLDALKSITPSNVMGSTTQKMATCFYCGKIGHDLRDCSKISETGRDYFARNMSAYEGIEESRKCLCIKCFEVGHWAISCPKGLMFKQQSHSQLGIGKAVDSTSGDDVAKVEKLAPSCDSFNKKLLEVPEGLFDAIKKLRLSRTDIHRWIHSRSSLSSLDGYFLRLRLGKWEKSRGGTGYYVACITREGKGKQPQGSKRPISVDIGGKSCLVESRYISNQDFLEDELMAWWSTTVKSGGTIPSEDDLKVKFEERIRLGF